MSCVRTQPEWMTYPMARRFLGIGDRALKQIVNDRGLTVRKLPGTCPKLKREEVEALAEEYTSKGHSSHSPAAV